MAVPRIFVSSTFYDLKYLRASLCGMITSLGFEAILSERGDVPFIPGKPPDASCYSEVLSCDILVLIIGGRYGSRSSVLDTSQEGTPSARYASVVRSEYRTAITARMPVYVAIERNVATEYETYKVNRERSGVRYAHVDSTDVFDFLAEVQDKQPNSPTILFDNPGELEDWLRLQWAGLFGAQLRDRTEKEKLSAIVGEVADLSATTGMLKEYLETILSHLKGSAAQDLIVAEQAKLRDAKKYSQLLSDPLVRQFAQAGVPPDQLIELFEEYRCNPQPGAIDVQLAAALRTNPASPFFGQPADATEQYVRRTFEQFEGH